MTHVLKLGFRPFYLLAAFFAIIAMSLWLLAATGRPEISGYPTGVLWHSHEMVFGFVAAVMAGFLFTAVRNWTGQPTPTGLLLALLALLWVVARVALYVGATHVGVLFDVLFLPAVTLAIAIPILRSRNQRNYKIVGLLAVISALHIGFHLALEGAINAAFARPLVIATIDVIAIVFAIVAGRIVPAFTRNAIAEAQPRNVVAIEYLVFGTLVLLPVLTLLAGQTTLPNGVTVVVLYVAVAANAIRLGLWQPHLTMSNPLLWMLPASYAWFPIALFLRALSAQGIVAPGVWMHALAAGALSSMMLAMMIRSSLGHTGRPLVASRIDIAAFLLLQVAVVCRILASVPGADTALIIGSGVAWIAAFGLFALRFLPILIGPRIDTKAD